jgi:hypothetical protein
VACDQFKKKKRRTNEHRVTHESIKSCALIKPTRNGMWMERREQLHHIFFRKEGRKKRKEGRKGRKERKEGKEGGEEGAWLWV